MSQLNYDLLRRTMVSNQLRTTAVNDPRVVDAMRVVPRERHVPVASAALAYLDRSIALGQGRALNSPMATGRLLTEAHPLSSDRVLVIGAATGYAAAVLAELVATVTALEEDAVLIATAQAASPSPRIRYVEGPLAAGWAANAPYDLILIDGAVEHVPQAIIDQLTPEGRLATGILDRGVTRLCIGRRAGTAFGLTAFADADAVILPGFDKPRGFVF